MAVYGNVKVRVFIHPANPGEEDGAVGTMARDINDYIVSLDSDDNEVLSITHTALRGDRVLTVITGGT